MIQPQAWPRGSDMSAPVAAQIRAYFFLSLVQRIPLSLGKPQYLEILYWLGQRRNKKQLSEQRITKNVYSQYAERF